MKENAKKAEKPQKIKQRADEVKTKAVKAAKAVKSTAAKSKAAKAVKAVKDKAQNRKTVSNNRLLMLITIVGRSKAEYYLDIIQSFDVNMQVTAMAHGTANAKMLSLLGLTDSDKAVIFSVVQEEKIAALKEELEDKFNTIKNGKGIACTVPLSSVIGTLIFGFLSNNKQTVREDRQNG